MKTLMGENINFSVRLSVLNMQCHEPAVVVPWCHMGYSDGAIVLQ